MKIISNIGGKTLQDELIRISRNADCIEIAVAFLVRSKLIEEWSKKMSEINIIVSLRPPTDYYILSELSALDNVNLFYLGKEFHSKIFLFYKEEVITQGVLGSSNFTNGGLKDNIETNICINDELLLNELDEHYELIYDKSNHLTPEILRNYKLVYDKWKKSNKQLTDDYNDFESRSLKNGEKFSTSKSLAKEAKEFNKYWQIVDRVKEMVSDMSKEKYPDIPEYFLLDHFWHFVKIIWYPDNKKTSFSENQIETIRTVYKEYIKWLGLSNGEESLRFRVEKVENFIKKVLSLEQIDELSPEQAVEVFKFLHSSNMPIKRFKADENFISNNSINKIRSSFKYLLHSNDDLAIKIDKLIDANSKYKLNHFGSSSIQELNGWMFPDEIPIRNKKADDAVNILGFGNKRYTDNKVQNG